jgi:hypothetical protein
MILKVAENESAEQECSMLPANAKYLGQIGEKQRPVK